MIKQTIGGGTASKSLDALVSEAAFSGGNIADRHESFGEIVRRFQDMALGCAYAVLSDFCLAEDAAQEAFLSAWGKLDQLHDPAAFPGWFKSIVLTQCNRMTRGKRLKFVPLEQGSAVSIPSADPQADLEITELSERVRTAIQTLPEHERIVTTLFYISEYSHKDIAAFLGITPTAVGKRLFSARLRLKDRILQIVKENLPEHRPSKDELFAEGVQSRLRAFHDNDWEPVTELAFRLEPDFRAEQDLWLRYRRQFDNDRYIRRHYIVEHAETGQLLGYGSIEQSIFLPIYRLFLVVDPKWLRAGVGDLLLCKLREDLTEVDAITVWHRNYSQLTEVLSFLEERGYDETMRTWDLRLDLGEADLTLLSQIEERVLEREISITTFQEERRRDPLSIYRLHEFLNEVKADDPQRQPYFPAPFESTERWWQQSGVFPEASFIAKDGERYVGFSDLCTREQLSGGLTFGFTGVARQYRNQGIATALKARAIKFACENGYRVLRAFNRTLHTELLAINERLGFRRFFCYVTMEQCLRPVVSLSEETLDRYVGTYQLEPSELRQYEVPEAFLVPEALVGEVWRLGDLLVFEAGMTRDLLFALSGSEFFIKEHYGRMRFEQDESGAVTGLTYLEGAVEIHARRVGGRRQ